MKYDTDHARFREDIGTYLAGGLPAGERQAFEAHAAQCPDCAAALGDVVAQDEHLRGLFAGAHPGEGLEERIVRRLEADAAEERSRFRMAFHPAVRRAAVGVAAALMLGGFGYFATQAASNGGLPTPWVGALTGSDAGGDIAAGQSLGRASRRVQLGANRVAQESLADDVVRATPTPAEMAKTYNRTLSARWGEAAPAAPAGGVAFASPGMAFRQQRAAVSGQKGEVAAGDSLSVAVAGKPVETKEDEGRSLERMKRAGGEAERGAAALALGLQGGLATLNKEVGGGAGGTTLGVSPAAGGAGGGGFGRSSGADFYYAVPGGGGTAARAPVARSEAKKADDKNGDGEVGALPNTGMSIAAPLTGVAPGAKDGKSEEAQLGWAFKPGEPQSFDLKQSADGAGVRLESDVEQKVKILSGRAAGDTPAIATATGGGAAANGPVVLYADGNVASNGHVASTDRFDDAMQKAKQATQNIGDTSRPFQESDLVQARRALEEATAARDTDPSKRGDQDVAQLDAKLNEARAALDKAEERRQRWMVAGQKGDELARFESNPAAPAQAQPAATQPAGTAAAATPNPASATAGRKIIRNGEMSFEVDGFDSAYVQITKIAAEEGGYVATTDSEKLANGKVRGVVTVRVPPERLDTMVLKLRGLGELKSSKIGAQDISKQYTDLESQLKASRAMEERLLNVIKTGKGEIKDLVEAEKQLGVYREKIEQIEGEVRYFNNLVSLSTLNVTLTERDIRTAALLSETEQVNMGVEAEDVEKARAATIKAVEEAKGRIVESDLKKLEAGQFAGRVVADVPPDAAGPLVDRLRQVGVVARLEISRKQTAPEGTVAPAQGGALPRIERRDTRFMISLYNLANVAPRQTTTLNLAAEDVEVAYRTVLDQVKSAGGRVVTSQLNRPKPDQTTGTITFEVPSEQADVLLGAVRSAGEVMRLDVNQNPDTQNVTQTKRGFAVQIFSSAVVAPRETTSLRVAARGVADAFNKLRETVRTTKGGRVLSSQLAEQDPANVSGTLDFEVRREDWATIESALRDAGQVVSRNVSRSSDAENTVDTKIRLQVAIVDEAALAPRETVTMQLAVRDVSGRYAALLDALGTARARVLQSQLNEQEPRTNVTATLTFDVRREGRAAVDKALADAGDVVSRNVARSTDTQNTLDDKVRLSLTIIDADRLPPRETTTIGMESADVEKSKEGIESLALGLGGRVVDSTLSREASGRVMAKVVADVPLSKALEMVSKTRGQGKVQFRRDARDENVPAGSLSRYRVEFTLANEDLIVESGQGLGSRIREGLRTSAAGLLWSVQLIVVGLFLVAPWVLIIWLAWRFIRRSRARRPAGAAPVPA